MTQYIEFTLSGKIPVTDEMIDLVESEGDDPDDVDALLEALESSVLEFVEHEEYDLR